jgi:hypothetical protein
VACRVGGRLQLHAGTRRAAGVLAGSLVLAPAPARAAPSGAGWEGCRTALHLRLRLPHRSDGSREDSFRLAPPRAFRFERALWVNLSPSPSPKRGGVPVFGRSSDAPRHQGVPATVARESGSPSPLRGGGRGERLTDQAASGPEREAAAGGLGSARVTFDLRLRDAPAAGGASPYAAAGLLGQTAAGPAGIRRLQFGVEGLSLGGRERLQASWLSLTGSDPRQSARRFAFRTEGSRLTLDGLFQESDDRLSDDHTLSAEDRTLMGIGWGSRMRSLKAGYQFGSGGALSASLLGLSASQGGVARQRLSWTGRGARLSLDLGRVDTSFDRLSALPEAERADVGQRRGLRWRDLSGGLRLAPWLSAEGLWSSVRSLVEARDQRRMRQQWVLAPTRGPRSPGCATRRPCAPAAATQRRSHRR